MGKKKEGNKSPTRLKRHFIDWYWFLDAFIMGYVLMIAVAMIMHLI